MKQRGSKSRIAPRQFSAPIPPRPPCEVCGGRHVGAGCPAPRSRPEAAPEPIPCCYTCGRELPGPLIAPTISVVWPDGTRVLLCGAPCSAVPSWEAVATAEARQRFLDQRYEPRQPR